MVRPLLVVSRAGLRCYLEERAARGEVVVRDEQGALWREDATNAHTDRFRSYVRHEIVPAAKAQNPQLLDTLCRTMNLIADEDDFMESLAEEALVNNAEQAEGYTLLLPSFGMLALPLKRRAIRSVLESLIGSEGRIESAAIEPCSKPRRRRQPAKWLRREHSGRSCREREQTRCAHRTHGTLPHASQARLTETFQSTLP